MEEIEGRRSQLFISVPIERRRKVGGKLKLTSQ
jgi:hypothetical protein